MRRVLNKDEVVVYEFLVPKKENLDGNQVRLMSCGILPTSSPGVGAFLGFPGRFVPLLASSVSLCDVALNPRILCIRIWEFSTASACVIFHVFFSVPQDKMHCQLSLTVGLCTPCQKSKLQQYHRFFFVGS